MSYHWTVYVGAREIGRITSNQDDGPEIALWLVRETVGDVDPLDVRVESTDPSLAMAGLNVIN